jgi:hypothetical protein
LTAVISTLNKKNVAVGHFIQILTTVSAYLAHYFLEEVVGAWGFFG